MTTPIVLRCLSICCAVASCMALDATPDPIPWAMAASERAGITGVLPTRAVIERDLGAPFVTLPPSDDDLSTWHIWRTTLPSDDAVSVRVRMLTLKTDRHGSTTALRIVACITHEYASSERDRAAEREIAARLEASSGATWTTTVKTAGSLGGGRGTHVRAVADGPKLTVVASHVTVPGADGVPISPNGSTWEIQLKREAMP